MKKINSDKNTISIKDVSMDTEIRLHGRIERGKLEEFAKENKYHCWKCFESANHYLTKKMVLKWLIYKNQY